MDKKQLGMQLRTILGSPKHLLESSPLRLALPIVLGLTGSGSAYGRLHQAGLHLAVRHVQDWSDGRLTFDVQEYDHGSCNPSQIGRLPELGLVGNGVLLTTFVFCFGAQLAAIQRTKTFAIDPVGSTGPAYKGIPYCYGFRSSWPDDCQAGLWRVIKDRNPGAKRWTVVSSEFAPDWMVPLKRTFAALANSMDVDLEYLGSPYGSDDFSATVEEMKRLNSDVYVLVVYGTDLVRITQELARQGMLRGPTYATVEFDDDVVTQVGHLWDGWYIGQEYLDIVDPPSDWSKLFLREFSLTYSRLTPHYYASLLYSAVFSIAEMVNRIVGFGGNLQAGDDYVKALEMSPRFAHVHGGSGRETGQLIMDVATHSAASIPLVALRAKASADPKTAEKIATFDVGGRNIRYF